MFSRDIRQKKQGKTMALIGTASAMCWKLCPLRRCLLPARNTCLFHYATRTGETWRKIQRRLYSFHRQHMSTQRTRYRRRYSRTCVKWPLSKRRFSRLIIAKCRSKVLQNAPKGAFCNTFDLHEATSFH